MSAPCQARRATALNFVLARRWGTVVGARRGRRMWCSLPRRAPCPTAKRAARQRLLQHTTFSTHQKRPSCMARTTAPCARGYAPLVYGLAPGGGGSRSTVLGPFATVVNSAPIPKRSSCARTNCGTDCPSGRCARPSR